MCIHIPFSLDFLTFPDRIYHGRKKWDFFRSTRTRITIVTYAHRYYMCVCVCAYRVQKKKNHIYTYNIMHRAFE